MKTCLLFPLIWKLPLLVFCIKRFSLFYNHTWCCEQSGTLNKPILTLSHTLSLKVAVWIVISFISEWIYMNIYYTCFQSDDKLWFKKNYLEVVVADHRLPDPQALHGSHQVLIVDKPFDGNVQLMVNGLDKNYIYNCWGGKPIHVHQSNPKKKLKIWPDQEILPGTCVPGCVDES